MNQLRALAIIGIIFTHCSAMYIAYPSVFNSFNWNVGLIFNTFQSFCIPIFICLSGALLINKKYSMGVFFKKRFSRVFVPFIAWGIIYIFIGIFLFGKGIVLGDYSSFSWNFAFDIFLSNVPGISESFWFIWMLLIVYLAILLINKFIERFSLNIVKYLLAIWLIIVVFTTGISYTKSLIFYIDFLGYALLGFYLINTDFTNLTIARRFNLNFKKLAILNWVLFIVFAGLMMVLRMGLSLNQGKLVSVSFFNILTVITVSVCILAFRYFSEYAENSYSTLIKSIYSIFSGNRSIISKLTNSLSSCSYGIYLVHIPVLFLSSIFIWSDAYFLTKPAIYVILFKFCFSLAISWAIVYILSKIPYLKKISGAN